MMIWFFQFVPFFSSCSSPTFLTHFLLLNDNSFASCNPRDFLVRHHHISCVIWWHTNVLFVSVPRNLLLSFSLFILFIHAHVFLLLYFFFLSLSLSILALMRSRFRLWFGMVLVRFFFLLFIFCSMNDDGVVRHLVCSDHFARSTRTVGEVADQSTGWSALCIACLFHAGNLYDLLDFFLSLSHSPYILLFYTWLEIFFFLYFISSWVRFIYIASLLLHSYFIIRIDHLWMFDANAASNPLHRLPCSIFHTFIHNQKTFYEIAPPPPTPPTPLLLLLLLLLLLYLLGFFHFFSPFIFY